VRISGSHRAERWEGQESTSARRPKSRLDISPKIVSLAQYDVRVRRELAHRRFVVLILRRVLRLVTLHALDAGAVALAAVSSAVLSDTTIQTGVPGLIAFVLAGLNLCRAYQAGEGRRDAQRLIAGVAIGALLAAIPGTLPDQLQLSGGFFAMFGLAAIALLILERRIVDAIVHQAYAHRIGLRRALIVARADDVELVLAGLSRHRDPRPDDQEIVGYVTPDRHRDAAALGTVDDVEQILEETGVSEVLVATSLTDRAMPRLADACFERGIRLFVIPSALQLAGGWAELTQVGRLPAYHLHPARLELPALVVKRACDLVLASLTLVIAVPLMLIIAVCIKLESGGPVFFRQRRVGLGGREFNMWKFRSMQSEAESRQDDIAHLNAYRDGRLFKLQRDPRITGVGRFLRRFSLDELPQLFNIIKGEMSLVGPRPPLPSEVSQYEPHHLVRLSVVPGLTGPWQVNGRNLITDFEEVVRLERHYIETWSLKTDLEIMLRTGAVVLSGKGAY
jgi:exopolysaccharide biosynthesis polyprenyl glycosylphosphotransferase